VGLFSKGDDLLEVGVVDVGVNSEEALEDILNYLLKVLRERDICARKASVPSREPWLHTNHSDGTDGSTDSGREDSFIVENALYPGHQTVDVFWSGAANRLLDLPKKNDQMT
jgi:hypothetical protein